MRKRRKKKSKLGFHFRPKTRKALKRFLFISVLVGIMLGGLVGILKLKAPEPRKVPPFVKIPGLIFVIDDIGHTRQEESLLFNLGPDVTYAILPFLKHSRYFGEQSHRMGAEVILHLPLESSAGTIPGPGLINSQMPKAHVVDLLSRNLASVPYHIGVNNHMGSGGTSNPELMRTILGELKRRGLFFLDSGTTLKSVAPGIGYELGIPVLRRDVFLDNVDSKEAVRQKVRELADVASKKGYAIGIGHYRHNTLSVLNEEIPKLKQAGYQIFSLSDLV